MPKQWKNKGSEGNHVFEYSSGQAKCKYCGASSKNRRKSCTPERESKVIYSNGVPIRDYKE